MPAAWKNSATSGDSGGAAGDEEAQPAAEPGAQLGEHELVGDARAWRAARRRAAAPARCSRLTSRPTPIAQVKIFSFGPPSSSAIVTTRPRTFSKMRGAAAMNVGETTARLSMILSTRPSTAAAEPVASCAASSTLPNECDSGSQRYCTSSSVSRPSESTATPS